MSGITFRKIGVVASVLAASSLWQTCSQNNIKLPYQDKIEDMLNFDNEVASKPLLTALWAGISGVALKVGCDSFAGSKVFQATAAMVGLYTFFNRETLKDLGLKLEKAAQKASVDSDDDLEQSLAADEAVDINTEEPKEEAKIFEISAQVSHASKSIIKAMLGATAAAVLVNELAR